MQLRGPSFPPPSPRSRSRALPVRAIASVSAAAVHGWGGVRCAGPALLHCTLRERKGLLRITPKEPHTPAASVCVRGAPQISTTTFTRRRRCWTWTAACTRCHCGTTMATVVWFRTSASCLSRCPGMRPHPLFPFARGHCLAEGCTICPPSPTHLRPHGRAHCLTLSHCAAVASGACFLTPTPYPPTTLAPKPSRPLWALRGSVLT
jgi:hypothetical protein